MQKLPDTRREGRSENASSQRSNPSGTVLLVRGFVVLMLVFSIFVFATRLMKYNELKEEKEKLEEQIEQSQDEIDKLNQDIAAPMDDEYIIKVAREKLNLYFPDETIFYGAK